MRQFKIGDKVEIMAHNKPVGKGRIVGLTVHNLNGDERYLYIVRVDDGFQAVYEKNLRCPTKEDSDELKLLKANVQKLGELVESLSKTQTTDEGIAYLCGVKRAFQIMRGENPCL